MQTAVDLKTQVQERVGEEPEGPPGVGGLIYYPLPEILQRKGDLFFKPTTRTSGTLYECRLCIWCRYCSNI